MNAKTQPEEPRMNVSKMVLSASPKRTSMYSVMVYAIPVTAPKVLRMMAVCNDPWITSNSESMWWRIMTLKRRWSNDSCTSG